MLDPRCPRCGGVLEPVAAPEAPRDVTAIRLASLSRSRRFDVTVTALVVLPLVLAAGKIGWAQAGPAGGAAALLLATLVACVALAPDARQR